jgi:hypothetical protein
MNKPIQTDSFADCIKNQPLWCGLYQEQKRKSKQEKSQRQMARYYANKRYKEQQLTTA